MLDVKEVTTCGSRVLTLSARRRHNARHADLTRYLVVFERRLLWPVPVVGRRVRRWVTQVSGELEASQGSLGVPSCSDHLYRVDLDPHGSSYRHLGVGGRDPLGLVRGVESRAATVQRAVNDRALTGRGERGATHAVALTSGARAR